MAKSPSYPKSRYARYRAPVVDRVNFMAFLRRSLRMFRNRWWLALVTVAIGSGTSVYLATTQPDIYRATSRLGIAPKINYSQRSSDRATVMEEKNNFVQDQLEYMRGGTVLAKVEEKMQDFRLPDNSVPTKKLTAGQGVGSTFIMSVDSPNVEYARRFARTWAQEFLAFKEELRNNVARKSMDKTRNDLSRQEERVTDARAKLDDFLAENQIATSQDTGDAARDLLVSLQRQLQVAQIQRQQLELRSAEQLADEKGGLMPKPGVAPNTAVTASGPITSGENPRSTTEDSDPLEKFVGQSAYRNLKLNLRGVEAEIRRRSESLKEKHPYLVQLEESRTNLLREIDDQLVLIDEKRTAEIDSLKKLESALEKQVEAKRADVIRLREISREFVRRTEEYSSEKVQLDNLNKELLALSGIQSNEEYITILDEGAASDKPVGPQRSRMIVMGVVLGLLSGLGLIFLLHRLDDRIDSAEDLEKALDEPILGQLPFVSSKDLRGGIVSVDSLETNNIFVEALRGVRSSIMFGEVGGSKQVLMATSSVPGDGKSTFTVNFAITLANAGNRVLLVDADLRRGTVASYFDLPSSPGLSDVLSGLEGWKDVLCGTTHKTLLVIPAGKSVATPGELLLSKGIKKLIEETRKDFDYVIFDSPPVIGMDDAASLASSCDGLIFVYRVGITSLKLARLAVNTVRQRGGRILGLILNGVSINNPDYYYTAYYYSHYTYGRPMRPALSEGEDSTRPERPRGARLLAALRDAENVEATSENGASPHEVLLDDNPVDVQATPAPPAGSEPPRPRTPG